MRDSSTKRCELVEHFQYVWIEILGKKQSLQSRAVLLDLFMMLKDKKYNTESITSINIICIYNTHMVYHANAILVITHF